MVKKNGAASAEVEYEKGRCLGEGVCNTPLQKGHSYFSFQPRIGLTQLDLEKADVRARAYAIRPYNKAIFLCISFQLRNSYTYFLTLLIVFFRFVLSSQGGLLKKRTCL